MNRTPLKGGRLKSAGYDARERRLELEFVDGAIKVYKSVPEEVWRRLLSSPNPASYHEDRIAEEYPVEDGGHATSPEARSRLDDLFGG
jgi:hypothetical protein